MKLLSKSNIFTLIVILAYAGLTLVSLNHGYFWDNIQQTSKEAHWFYLTDFSSLLMPQNPNAEIVATGYHPPLMGIMTALLWKIFGYKLWVSHVFVFIWSCILIYNLKKVISRFFNENLAGWVLLIVLFESTLLTQFAIASSDFILFTAFVVSLRAILERKSLLLAIGIFFLCTINMRGVFAGALLFVSQVYYNFQQTNKFTVSQIFRAIIPYLPTLLILAAYYGYYFYQNGWFFAHNSTEGHYSIPRNFGTIIKHAAEFVLRSVENGRISIWAAGCLVAWLWWKHKTTLPAEVKLLVSIFAFLTGLYVLFIFITQMPFSARYFMPQFFILTMLAMIWLGNFLKENYLKLTFILIIGFELTGNLWVYPDKIAKSWDCTLAHLPYYELRKECFEYIDQEKLDYNKISAGFCLYGNRRFVELGNRDNRVGTTPDREYFIYSNISNVEDGFFAELQNNEIWTPIKEFRKGFVGITIFKRNQRQYSIDQ
ncbi:MAG TPA: hypothetical protein VK152_11965 [Paludibacter sp.]|nr:hypothetical protein [Paludibacter sp.]